MRRSLFATTVTGPGPSVTTPVAQWDRDGTFRLRGPVRQPS
ncbi:hypothetical protein ACFFWC_17485 [Plantactinospora siamensis]|uniref:Uncharacterized protein n=1 Tax=Plantactinospora siamensis TaxID=555372 RepID=A0ABV6NPG0_9ACTN